MPSNVRFCTGHNFYSFTFILLLSKIKWAVFKFNFFQTSILVCSVIRSHVSAQFYLFLLYNQNFRNQSLKRKYERINLREATKNYKLQRNLRSYEKFKRS